MAALFLLTLWRNFNLIKGLPGQISFLLIGLLSFGLANILFFFSAGQVYSDPFVLIVLGLCFGSFLSVPSLLVRHQFEAGRLRAT